MSNTRAFKNLVATQWGFNVYRSVDALNRCVHKMLWEEMREEILYKRHDYDYWGIFGTKASDEIDQRERAGRPKQLGKVFLKQINEQIKRAEIVENARRCAEREFNGTVKNGVLNQSISGASRNKAP